MKSTPKLTIALFAGAAIGGLVVHGLHAQAKPPVYSISEIDISNPDAYAKEFVPVAQAALKAGGGRLLAGGKATTIVGEPPKSRVTIWVYDSMEKLQASRSSAEYKEALKIGDKYAKFRTFAVEGVAQ
jgi:uncharacterized protein (DUF1330 family)